MYSNVRRPTRVRVKLTCGCAVLLRNTPFGEGSRFACESGLSHGYQLNWVSWTNAETGASGVNSRI